GFLIFLDPPKATARDSLARLARLGIAVKIVTGDNPAVAKKVCADLGVAVAGTLTGSEVDALDDDALGAALERTTNFARVRPEQKSRIIRAQRRAGVDVGFLGDGVNEPWPCTTPTLASRSTPPSTWRRTLPTWSCWRRTSGCWRTAWWKA